MKKTMFFLSVLLILSLKSIALDLSIGTSTVSSTTVSAGQTFSVSNTVSSSGGGIFGYTIVKYYLSTSSDPTSAKRNQLLGSSVSFRSFPSFLTTNLSTLCNVAPGTYYIYSVVDPENAITETNELNNVSVVPIIITAGSPNLTINSPNANPTIVKANTTINVNCNVKNTSYSPSFASELKIYLSDNTTWDAGDVLLSTVSVGSLNPLASQAVSESVFISVSGSMPQTKYIIFKADANNANPECDEYDNVGYKQITISYADLTIQNISNASFQNASIVNITGLVSNIGSVEAKSIIVNAYLSDDNILDNNDITLRGVGSLPLLSAGASAYVNVPVYIPSSTTCTFPQQKYIFLMAFQTAYQDLNEANNKSCNLGTIISPIADELSISDFYIGFGNDIYTGTNETWYSCLDYIYYSNEYYSGSVNVGITIKNNTCKIVNNLKCSRTYTSYTTGIPHTDIIVIPSIPANGEYNVSINYQTWDCTGLVDVVFQIDPNNEIWESEKNNNIIHLTANNGADPWGKSVVNNIINLNNETISIYPNPANENIRINNAENSNLVIYDILGKIVMTEAIITNDFNLNVSSLAKGNYVAKIMNGTQVITKKIVIIK